MLPILAWALWPVLLALFAKAQTEAATQWYDALSGITFWRYYQQNLDTAWGYLLPQLNPAGQAQPDEFIGIFTAPVSAGWIGNSLGGGMRSNLLIVGWVNGATPVVSARYVQNYAPPASYAGPRLTVLGTSGANATHQRIVYRCQNCTTWTGGSLNLNGTATLGFATHGAIKPNTPADPNSSLYQHTLAGQHTFGTANAHTSQSTYNTYLQQLVNAPPLAGQPPTTVPPTTPPVTTPPVTSNPPTPTIPAVMCPGAPNPSYALTVASGWRVTPVLGRLTTPRGVAIDPKGNLIVVERGKGITGHTLNADGCVTSSKTIIADAGPNHAIDFNPSGTKLFASSSDIAWSWDYNPDTMTATNRKTLVTGMNNNYHFTRTILIPKGQPDLMVVSVGSNDNIDQASFQVATGRAMIKVFDLRTLPANGVAFNNGAYGKVMGYGLRNDVGIAEDRAGLVYSIENSLDNAYRVINGQNRDVHINNPAEKVYRLGDPTNPTNLFGGYPYCFSVWEPNDFTDSAKQVGDWFVQNNSGQYNDAWCNTNCTKPIVVLPPHTAPLDMKFGLGTDTNLYVGMHGSWNRNPPQGYKVVVVPGRFSSTGVWSPTVEMPQTKTSFTDLLTNRNENQCQSGCFRPVGLAFSQNGMNLYVASDTSGEVFLLRRVSGPTVPGGPGTTPPITTPPVTTPPTTPPVTTPPTTVAPPQPTQTMYGQCGGQGWTGPTQCPSNGVCRSTNQWYSQCVPR